MGVITRGRSKADSRITALSFRRLHIWPVQASYWKNPMGYGPGDKGISAKLRFFQESAPPNLRTVYAHVQKSKKYCQETCMEKQEAAEEHKKEARDGRNKRWEQS